MELVADVDMLQQLTIAIGRSAVAKKVRPFSERRRSATQQNMMNVKLMPIQSAAEDSQLANRRRRPASLGSEVRRRCIWRSGDGEKVKSEEIATKNWADEYGPNRETQRTGWRINDAPVCMAPPPSKRSAWTGRRVPESLMVARRRSEPGKSCAAPAEGSFKPKEGAAKTDTDELVRTDPIKNNEIISHAATSYTDVTQTTDPIAVCKMFQMMRSKRDCVVMCDLMSEPSTAVPTEDSLIDIEVSEDDNGSEDDEDSEDGDVPDALMRTYSIRNIDEITSTPAPSTSKVLQVCSSEPFQRQSKRGLVMCDLMSEPSTAMSIEDSLIDIEGSEDDEDSEDGDVPDALMRTYSIRNIDEITSTPVPSTSKVSQVCALKTLQEELMDEPSCGTSIFQMPQSSCAMPSEPAPREPMMESCGATESGKNEENRSPQIISPPTARKSNRPNTLFTRALSQARSMS